MRTQEIAMEARLLLSWDGSGGGGLGARVSHLWFLVFGVQFRVERFRV